MPPSVPVLRSVWGALRSDAGKRISGNFGWLVLGNGGALACGFLSMTYVARTLGQSAFGDFSYAQTLATYAAVAVDLGLNAFGSRAVARNPDQAGQSLANIGLFQTTLAIAMIAVSAVLAYGLGIWPSELRPLILASVLWTLPFALNIEWLHLGFQRMRVVGLSRLTQQVSILAVTLLLVADSNDAAFAALARVVGGLVSALWLVYSLPRGILRGVRFKLREALRYTNSSRWFWFSALLIQIYHGSDVIVLRAFRSAEEVGRYSAGFRLMGLAIAVISLLNVAMYPMLSAEHKTGPAGFAKLRKMYLVAAFAIALVVLLVGLPAASPLVRLAYGVAYLATIPVLQILVVAAAVLTINGALSQPLLAAGHESSVFMQVLLTAIVNVTLNLCLVPYFGPVGAACAYCASVVFGTGWLLVVYLVRMNEHSPSIA